MPENNSDMLKMSVREFVTATAAKTPTPGGGSVAGVVGALSVGLGEMSLNFTQGKKKFAEHEEFYAQLGSRLNKARQKFQDLVAEDVSAYSNYQETFKLDDGPEKDEAMELALAAAIDVPRQAAALALAVLVDMKEFSDKCSKWLVSDLVASAALAVATTRLCDYNVRINTPQLSNPATAAELKQSSADDVAKALSLLADIEQAISATLP